MILKKPYGLLIKHFRLIHLILSVLMIYATYKMRDIYKFFLQYISNGWITVSLDDVKSYINFTCYLTIILILIILGIVFYLMNLKKKKSMYYKFAIPTYIVSFLSFIVLSGVLRSAASEIISPLNLRIYRDLAMTLYIVQALLIVIPVLRGIGFDVKKFNFKKDIADLNLEDVDSEEVEVNFNFDKHKFKRGLNRFGRNSNYIFLRNKLLIYRILLVIAIVMFGYFAVNVLFINKIYKENTIVKLDRYSIKVNKSYVTKYDSNNNIINNNYKYIVVNFTPINRIEDNTFAIDKVDIKIGNNYYFPDMTIYSDFKDIGYGYANQKLQTNSTLDYIMVFKVPSDVKTNRVLLRYINGTQYKKNSSSFIYKNIRLRLNDDTNKIMNINNKISDTININNNIFKVDKFDISSTMEYSVSECSSDEECTEIKKTIKAVHSNFIVARLTGEFKLDNKGIAKSYKDYAEYYTSMMYIKYNINGSDKTLNKVLSITPSKVISSDKELYIEVPSELETATNIDLHIKSRNSDYSVKIK